MTRTALPRLSREGFVPAGPEKRTTKRHMLNATAHLERLH